VQTDRPAIAKGGLDLRQPERAALWSHGGSVRAAIAVDVEVYDSTGKRVK